MKTKHTTPQYPTAMKTQTPTTPRTLQVQPFTVTTEWLSVSTNILARHEERMQRIRSYQTDRVRFCSSLVTDYLLDSSHNRRLEMECMVNDSLQGRRTSRITFQIEADKWAEIVTLCERIHSTPTAFIRAAIASAAQTWVRFDKEQQTRTA